MAFILKDGQKVPLALVITDSEGNPVTADGDPTWASSDFGLVTITPDSGDATKAVASTVAGPGLGTATITAAVDADLGEGVVEVTGTLDIEVVAGDAAIVNIEAGTPEVR